MFYKIELLNNARYFQFYPFDSFSPTWSVFIISPSTVSHIGKKDVMNLLGHTHFTHSFLLCNSPDPICLFCGTDPSVNASCSPALFMTTLITYRLLQIQSFSEQCLSYHQRFYSSLVYFWKFSPFVYHPTLLSLFLSLIIIYPLISIAAFYTNLCYIQGSH